ncbi:hypothetical protein MAF45_04750 [Mesosutterella sp. OilRF-GAM-744-9]|uniref:Sulfatase N-terminal domain-containing protein n=1 Tax=Mesosutterella porci TaxID=2915351 RepID=A0ABS9MR10_9BURK|nr:hypothetical protein [Mesosutterella sp. oilRF-744-WT-GAM-9]MCG5030754.1 hypothetical protein [Mesosutterella sp. oilRF-744-WT-GAM-9]MCI6531205.1 hypothetical protein [Mesosutterella sp.]
MSEVFMVFPAPGFQTKKRFSGQGSEYGIAGWVTGLGLPSHFYVVVIGESSRRGCTNACGYPVGNMLFMPQEPGVVLEG